jgi:hypothetical protein
VRERKEAISEWNHDRFKKEKGSFSSFFFFFFMFFSLLLPTLPLPLPFGASNSLFSQRPRCSLKQVEQKESAAEDMMGCG